tara:strand:- start:200 stop:475 length:276 start_codon:yes stop_codon:yes gene_type:complete
MAYFVYLIGSYNKSKLTTYVGYTNNLKKRLKLHNQGRGAKFTRGRSWKIIYTEKYAAKSEAILRECCIKKDRKFINLIKKSFYENFNITTL